MTIHFETAEFIDYQRGLLTEDEVDTLLAHCKGCRTCSNRLAMVIALREVAARRRLIKRSALVVSGLAAVIVAVFAMTAYAPPGLLSAESDSAPATSQRSPGLLAEYATTERPDRTFLLLRFRDGTPVARRDDRELRIKSAVDDLWAGRPAPAIPALRALWAEAPSEEIAAYLGIALYLTQQRDDEVEAFLEVGTRTGWTTLGRYSTFYLANHYLRTDRNAAAYALLRVLAADRDAPGSAARGLLEALPDETDLPDLPSGR